MSEENEQQLNETKPPVGGDDDKLQAEIQNSIKLRKRAQDAEERIAKIEADAEKVRQAKLKEDGEYKVLIDEQNTELEALRKRDAEYSAAQKARRKLLLDKLSDDDKEIVEDMPLAKLEKYVGKQKVDTGAPPPPAGARHREPEGDYPGWAKATPAQRQAHLDSFKR
jgi:uncharacterized protein (DUF927 family)